MRKNAIFVSSIVLLFVMFGPGCGEEEKPQKIDLRKKLALPTEDEAKDVLFFGVSGGETPQHIHRRYAPLVDYLGKMTGHKIKLVQRRTYNELNELLEKGDLDFAWLASGAYVSLIRSRDVDILALPSKDDKSYYQACIIVHRDSPIDSFSELSGKSFAFVDPLSIAGYYYPAYLLSKVESDADRFFSKAIFSGGHDHSIRLILNKDVDGASVSSYVLDGIQEENYKIRKETKVIQKSPSFAVGPIVAKKEMPIRLKEHLREIMLNMHRDEGGKETLATMNIDQFIRNDNPDYGPVREMIEALGQL